MEELSSVRAELAKLQKEKALQQTASDSNVSNEIEHARSSTVREDSAGSVNESLLASVNNMSLSTMNIPECKPSEGEVDIDKKGYEYWKNILVASLNLIQATDERTKMDVFSIKAGPDLLELLQGTKSSAEMPDEHDYPFSNALARLDGYFGSRAYMLSQRSKLLNMRQRPGETNIQFVRRVAASAKLCGYEKGEDEMEALSRTVIKSANDKRVRTLAQRNWVKQGSLNDLIDQVREYEAELSNEEEFQKMRKPQGTASVAAIANERGQSYRSGRFNNGNRGRGAHYRAPVRKQEPSRKACWRCASIYHGPTQCPCIETVCHYCKEPGHLARCCPNRNQARTAMKRRNESDDEGPPRKVAAIKNEEEKNQATHVDVSEIE